MDWLADNVTEVAIQGLWTNNRPIVTVVHVQREEDDAEESARDVLNNWQDHIVGWQPNNYTLQGARFTDKNEAEGATGFIIPNPAKDAVGEDTGAAPAPGLATLCKKIIASHVGHRAGRMYLPPQAEVNVTEDGFLAPAVVTSINGNLAAFHAGLSGAGGNRMVVAHKSPSPGFSDVSIVTAILVDPLAATQRRRMRR